MAGFRMIGVLDLMGGKAVHAKGGNRDEYLPVERVAGEPIPPGDAEALARAYLELGVRELYVADLDAIRRSGFNDAIIARIAQPGVPVWLDAGITSVRQAEHAIGLGARMIVVGLETLPSFEILAEICGSLDPERIVFSLDLRDGVPMTDALAETNVETVEITRRGLEAGVRNIILLDLDRVGGSGGVDHALIADIRRSQPAAVLFAGGGVSGPEDLVRLHTAGCAGALVATALQKGRLACSPLETATPSGPKLSDF